MKYLLSHCCYLNNALHVTNISGFVHSTATFFFKTNFIIYTFYYFVVLVCKWTPWIAFNSSSNNSYTIRCCFITDKPLNSSVSTWMLNIAPQPPLVSSTEIDAAFGNRCLNFSKMLFSDIGALSWEYGTFVIT